MSAESPVAEFSPAYMIAVMGIVGLLSGLIIVTAYEATLPAIKLHKAQTLRDAVKQVLPGTAKIQRMAWRNNSLVAAEDGPAEEEAIFASFDAAGTKIGYAIPGAGPGFQDTIRLLYGYRIQDRRIVGLQILDSKETPGIGDKIYKDAAFRANFADLAVAPPIKAVKNGTKSAANEIDAITGATISSKAIARILNAANSLWLARIPEAP